MTILTHQMRIARRDNVGNNLKLWFPCNDAGNSITDLIAGVTLDDDATSEHDIAHAIGMGTGADIVNTDLANINIPKQGLALLAISVGTSYATTSILLGSGSTKISLSGSGVSLVTSAGTVNGLTGASGGTTLLLAAAWDTSNLYTYLGQDADAALVDTDAISADISAALPEALEGGYTLNSAALPSDLYGLALFDFTKDGLPSDLLTGINWMKNEWVQGHKLIYPEWKNRA